MTRRNFMQSSPTASLSSFHPLLVRRSSISSSSSFSSSTIANDTTGVVRDMANEAKVEAAEASANITSLGKTNTTSNRTTPATTTMGGLRRLPVVKSPKELTDAARKKVLRLGRTTSSSSSSSSTTPKTRTVPNAKLRARKQGAETLNALTQALCIPLRDIVNGYRYIWKRLHPFERVVADLTARNRQQKDGLTLSQVLDDLHEGRKLILELGKDWIAKVKSSETAREADDYLQQGMQALFDCFDQVAAPSVTSLVDLQKALRQAPIVNLHQPTVVAVGAPNVGKSSIIRCISSATPEINNYPFTTRGMTLGHVQIFWSPPSSSSSSSSFDHHNDENYMDNPFDHNNVAKVVIPSKQKKQKNIQYTTDSNDHDDDSNKYAFAQLCQIMDTPGLLVRPDEERNEMESLTLAAMQHLPTAVMFVMDLSGEAGDKCSSVQDQLQLRREIRSRFPKRPWIDVISKVDMGIVGTAQQELEDILRVEEEIKKSTNKNSNNDNSVSSSSASSPPPSYIELSIHKGTGVDELKKQVVRMLGEVQLVLDAMAVAGSNRGSRSGSSSSSSSSATDNDE